MSSNPAQEQRRQDMCDESIEQEGDRTEQTRSEQERESEQNNETGSERKQGGAGQERAGDKENDDEDEESPQKDEAGRKKQHEKKGPERKGDSEEEVEARPRQEVNAKNVETSTTNQSQESFNGREHKSDSSSINEERSREFETKQTPPAAVKAALLNVIIHNNLDVFLTTETWLQRDTTDRVLREALPQHFSFFYQVRAGRGGGVAIQFSQVLQAQQIHYGFITTFEYVATVLKHNQWDKPVPNINVYHPPGYNKDQFRKFLDEFQALLDEVFKHYSSIIVTGDFNIWVDQHRRTFTDEFDFLLAVNNLDQHVKCPTHKKGHTLDLVITRNVEISGLFVRDDAISDHFTVYFDVRPESDKENVVQDKQAEQFMSKEE